jgi:hypothetical protein
MAFSKMLTVLQHFPDRRLADVAGSVRQELEQSGFAQRVPAGASVAIGVGSRGIANIATITRAAVEYWKSKGAQPFIFPAMGSHGAATAEGQSDVLAHYGIIEETVGCPIRSSLETIALGATPEGINTFLDRHASQSDGIMLIGRVKWHTDFEGLLESGLFKMMAIGLGKWTGAQHYHTHAYKIGLEATIRSIGRKMLRTGKILGGLAILEDAYHNTGQVTAVPVAAMEQREEELLALVKSWMGKIPMDLDLLIIDENGKNISGAGMDTKVVNRSVQGGSNLWDVAPRIERVFVRSLSSQSYGNAAGIGMADIVTDRLVNMIDLNSTYINTLTASSPGCGAIPIHFPTDKECIERIAATCGKLDPAEVTIGRIRNTMELTPIVLSENLRSEIESNPLLEIAGPAYELEFDAAGNLLPIKAAVLEHLEASRHVSR